MGDASSKCRLHPPGFHHERDRTDFSIHSHGTRSSGSRVDTYNLPAAATTSSVGSRASQTTSLFFFATGVFTRHLYLSMGLGCAVHFTAPATDTGRIGP